MDFWFEADTLREISNMTRVCMTIITAHVGASPVLFTHVCTGLSGEVYGLSVSPLRAVLLVSGLVARTLGGTLYLCFVCWLSPRRCDLVHAARPL